MPTPPRHRTGSVFIFAMGMMLVMTALAYSFMSSMRLRRDANTALHFKALAEMTARQGTAHAIEVLHQDYLAQPGLPTHLGLRYRTAFAPIDTLRIGKHLRSNTPANAKAYNPMGSASSMEDDNENDTKTDLYLTTPYNGLYQTGGVYGERAQGYGASVLLQQGFGRYLEPGQYHTDLPVADYIGSAIPSAGKPVSFHLEHPIAANAAHADPAVRRGENWLPDRNDPLYLDRELKPVADRKSARYRFRYAVAIEDLSGHLPISWQAPYTDIAPAVAKQANFTAASSDLHDELDHGIAARYADSLNNLAPEIFGASWSWQAWLIGHGRGTAFYTDANNTASIGSHAQLRNFTATDLAKRWDYPPGPVAPPPPVAPSTRWYQPVGISPAPLGWGSRPDVEYPALTSTTGFTGRLTTAFRGPPASWGNLLASQDLPTRGGMYPSCYLPTPFARRPVVTTTPGQHYTDSRVDCPWQLNLPTTAPAALTAMLYAYMPLEFQERLFLYKKVRYFDGMDGSTPKRPKWRDPKTPPVPPAVDPNPDPDPPGFVSVPGGIPRAPRPNIPLHDPAGPFSAHFGYLAAPDAYPGTNPAAPGPAWRNDLGKDIDLNTTNFGLTGWNNAEVAPRSPFWGVGEAPRYATLASVDWVAITSNGTLIEEWWDTDLAATPPGTNGKQTYGGIPDSTGNYGSYAGVAFDKKTGGFKNEDSYFMDLAVGLLHALTVAQAAWMPDNGAGSDFYPLDGRVQYPAGLTNPELQPLLADGKPNFGGSVGLRDRDVMDQDADGDGIVDSPSAFDAVWKVDRQFVWNMGEHFGATTTPASPAQGLYLVKVNPHSYGPDRFRNFAELVAWTPSFNIRGLKDAGRVSAAEAQRMELVLNDMRLSFFGSSAQYADFKGIDFDGDLQVQCSGYPGGQSPVLADRFADIVPATGRFSLTGNFLFQKSHFFRIFVRGEVFDTLRNLPAEWTLLETVYTVDPAGRIYNLFNAAKPARDPDGDGSTMDAAITDSQVLFQRNHWIRHQSYRPRAYP